MRAACGVGLVLVLALGSGCGSRVHDRAVAAAASVPARVTTTSRTPDGAGSTTQPTTTAPTTTVDTAAAVAQITANWQRFFAASTPLADREALLEDGPQHHDALVARSADPLQAQASATVRSVTVTDAQHAAVVYDVSIAGTVALPNAQGTAVLQAGTWKVSAESFCSLVTLGASGPVPGCG